MSPLSWIKLSNLALDCVWIQRASLFLSVCSADSVTILDDVSSADK